MDVDITTDDKEAIVETDAELKADDTQPDEVVIDEPINERQAIAEKYNQKRNEELGVDDEEEPEANKAEPEEPEEPEQIEVTINGNKKMVDKERIDAAGGVENYQKNISANMRLQEAAEERKRISQEREELTKLRRQLEQERQQYAQSLSQPKQAAESPPVKDEQSDLVSKYNEAMFEGDTEQANELLAQITAANKPTVDVEAIKREAALEARRALQRDNEIVEQRRRQAELQQANAEFQATYPEIIDDPNLYELTNQTTIKLQQQHPEWSPSRVIEEAAKETIAWKHNLIGGNQTEARTNAKRAISSVKSGTGRAQAKPQPQPMTKAEYIKSLRQQRGLE